MERQITVGISSAVLFLLLCLSAYGQIDVLVLTGNVSQAEFPVLSNFDAVDGTQVAYEQTNDRTVPDLAEADILWIGQGEICENQYFLDAATEQAILDFAQNGGIIIVIGQDSDDNRPCEIGWFPGEVTGVERGAVEVFEVTDEPEVGDLFTAPNEIANAHHDDTWTEPGDEIIPLSTINAGVDVGISLLPHGRGFYLLTGLENETAADVAVNTPIMENLIHYAVELTEVQAVEVEGKLPVTWGVIKANY